MSECQQTTDQISGQQSTHRCPGCQGPAYCAMEDGKSINTCWCFTEEVPDNDGMIPGDAQCLCRPCLLNRVEDDHTPQARHNGIKDCS